MTTFAGLDVADPCAERLIKLMDDFEVLEAVSGAVVVTGTIRGTDVVAFATDPTVQGGALGVDSCRAIADATPPPIAPPDIVMVSITQGNTSAMAASDSTPSRPI